MAAALGGVGAGFRLLRARIEDGDDELAGLIELVPPGATMPAGPRTRANVKLDVLPGGAGDMDVVPGRGCSSLPNASTGGRSRPPRSPGR